jgi:hypothetical protein
MYFKEEVSIFFGIIMKKLKITDQRTNTGWVKLLENIEYVILNQSPELFYVSMWLEAIAQKKIDLENRDYYNKEVTDEYKTVEAIPSNP